MNIYLDLDETLIHTRVLAKPETEHFHFRLGGWDYYTILRPSAYNLINLAWQMGHARILTNATYGYASLINEYFEFGFTPEQIIARDDYVTYKTTGWSGLEVEVPNASINDTTAILIDNMFPDDPGAINKMSYLGIKTDRYIQVPEFHGNEDKINLSQIKKKIEEIRYGC